MYICIYIQIWIVHVIYHKNYGRKYIKILTVIDLWILGLCLFILFVVYYTSMDYLYNQEGNHY